MDASTITTIISSLGFPIFCCLALGWWIKTTTETFNAQLEAQRNEHKEEIKALKDSIDSNTIAITNLLAYIKKE